MGNNGGEEEKGEREKMEAIQSSQPIGGRGGRTLRRTIHTEFDLLD